MRGQQMGQYTASRTARSRNFDFDFDFDFYDADARAVGLYRSRRTPSASH